MLSSCIVTLCPITESVCMAQFFIKFCITVAKDVRQNSVWWSSTKLASLCDQRIQILFYHRSLKFLSCFILIPLEIPIWEEFVFASLYASSLTWKFTSVANLLSVWASNPKFHILWPSTLSFLSISAYSIFRIFHCTFSFVLNHFVIIGYRYASKFGTWMIGNFHFRYCSRQFVLFTLFMALVKDAYVWCGLEFVLTILHFSSSSLCDLLNNGVPCMCIWFALDY